METGGPLSNMESKKTMAFKCFLELYLNWNVTFLGINSISNKQIKENTQELTWKNLERGLFALKHLFRSSFYGRMEYHFSGRLVESCSLCL